MHSVSVMGNSMVALNIQLSGTRNMVTKREMSIVSMSDRMVTINAEKNTK